MARAPATVFVAFTPAEGGRLQVMQFVTAEYGATVRVMTNEGPVEGEVIHWEREATDEAIEAELAKVVGPGASWRRVDLADIPQERDFRDAWVDTGESIEYDMPKVRAIAMRRIRDARNEAFAPLDAEYNRAIGQSLTSGDTSAALTIERKRQELRDLPADVEGRLRAAHTVDEVRAIVGE